MPTVGQERRQMSDDAIAVGGQRVLEPLEGLDDTHGWAAGPVSLLGAVCLKSMVKLPR